MKRVTLEDEDDSGGRLCEYWGTMFQAREERPTHHHREEILRVVQQALDGINWTIDRAEFDDFLALKERFGTWTRWTSLRCLQMCWWPWFEVPLSCLSSCIRVK